MSKFTEKTINYINSIESADARFDLTNLLERAANRYAKKMASVALLESIFVSTVKIR
jgi:hypothetical protein